MNGKSSGLFESARLILIATILFFMQILSALPASALTSQFLIADSSAALVMAGAHYDMADAAWLAGGNQNKNTFAYKIFAALLMLGYQTEISYLHANSPSIPQLLTLHAFQARNGISVSNFLTSDCLQKIDELITVREQALAPLAQGFSLYDHMQPLHANDISKDTLAVIYSLPMAALPEYLQMSIYEQVQCINGQCNGFIQDPAGNDLSNTWPINLSTDYRFSGAYFDPLKNNSRLPSAAVHVHTVLHEYAHYLDGINKVNSNDPLLTKFRLIDTSGFYAIGYDLNSSSNGCYTPRSTNPMDWITKYAAQLSGYGNCAPGSFVIAEDWAESFSMYVADGRDFRAAALQSTFIAQKYNWLKDNIFHGLEYDTDLPRDLESGCNDVSGASLALPGYAHCNDNYVWNFTLPVIQSTVDTVPAPFSFGFRTDVSPAIPLVSGSVTIQAINRPAAISISGGEYSINGGSFITAADVVNRGDSVRVRLNSSPSYSTTTTATITIGGICGTFDVTTRPDAPPVISGSPTTTVTAGTSYSFIPSAAYALNFSISGIIPPGLNFNTTTGALSGTPTTPGDYANIVITASNIQGSTVLPAFTITVVPPLPVIVWGNIYTNGRVGDYYSFIPQVSYATVFSINGTIPPGLSFDEASGRLSGIATTVGTYSGIVITAINSTGSTQLPAATITVSPPVPTIWGAPATLVTMGVNYPTFIPMVENAVSFSITGNVPPGLDFDTASGILSGIPTVVGTYADIVITVVNGEGSAALPAFTIMVLPKMDTFSNGGAMVTARQFHTATLLQNGMVLVTGGSGVDGVLSSAELYDPVTNSWSTAGAMVHTRTGHTATLLANGKVLVVGGYDQNFEALASAELYDVVADSWSVSASLAGARHGHSATLLPGDIVMVAGGFDSDFIPLAAVELYDPSNDSWSTAKPMADARSSHTATLLSNGSVLVSGGSGNASSELYDPVNDSWSSGGSMLDIRLYNSTAALADGRLLAAGGSYFEILASAELYDPITNLWSAAASLVFTRQSHSASMLSNGTLLVAGGYNSSNGYLAVAELYHPAANRWIIAGSMSTPRTNHTATLLQNGLVLQAGGSDGLTVLASTELFNPSHAIQTSAGPGGQISTSQTVMLGLDSAPVVVTPDSGHHIASVLVDGISQIVADPSSFSYDFSSVTTSHSVEAVFALNRHPLTVTFAGSGEGSVNSDTAGIHCSGNSCPTAQFDAGTTVSLMAAASQGSSLSGWSEACQVDSNGWCRVVMDGPRSVTVTFDALPLVRLVGAAHTAHYGLLAGAYNAAVSGDTILATKVNPFVENLVLNRPVNLTIRGGYDLGYVTSSGMSVLQGQLVVQSGKLTVDNLTIR